MWIPGWLWNGYSKLYSVFGEEAFDFSASKKALSLDDARARVVVSRLRRAGFLAIFERIGKRRSYRVMDPSLLTFAEGAGLPSLSLSQGRYQKLVLLWCRRLLSRYGSSMCSIVLYGSVARGTANPESDLDFLLIADHLERSYSARVRELVALETDPEIAKEREFLRLKGYSGRLSNLIYTVEESKRFRWVYLDMIREGLVLFDRHNHFTLLKSHLEAQMKLLGTKRIVFDDGTGC